VRHNVVAACAILLPLPKTTDKWSRLPDPELVPFARPLTLLEALAECLVGGVDHWLEHGRFVGADCMFELGQRLLPK
jgi:hypothetical protein